MDIKLPHARAITQEEGENTIIEISHNNEIMFNGEVVPSYEALEESLNGLAADYSDGVIIIKADKDINYGAVVKVMGLCKSKNFHRLGLTALQEKE